MITPTPRNAALKATGMRRRYCPETEVTALTAERDYNHECISRLASATGTLGEKSERVVEVAISTIAALSAEVERLTKQRDNLLKPMRDQAIARAERAEATLGKLQELHGCSQEMVVHWCEHAAKRSLELDFQVARNSDLFTQRDEAVEAQERAQAERDQLVKANIENADSYRLMQGRVMAAQAELATERARLDWVFRNCKVEANDYTTGNRDVYAIHDREDLGAAMKEDAK